MPIPAYITDPPAHLRALHTHYCVRSGLDLMYNMMRENTWKEWLQFCGWAWGAAEISLVIHHLREEIRRQKRNDGALRFSNLIGAPARFEEDLAAARRDARPRKVGPVNESAVAAPSPQESPLQGSSFFTSLLKKP